MSGDGLGAELDARAAARLIAAQFPELAGEPVCVLDGAGTDTQVIRIGERWVARLPKAPWAAGTARREAAILARFRASPLDVPEVYGLGEPDESYPQAWTVLSWLPGAPLGGGAMADAEGEAVRLAAFFRALREVAPDTAFGSGADNNGRGAPLATRSARFEAALEKLPDFDTDFARRLWAAALAAGKSGAAVWLHGDVHPGNVLVEEGRISGVIDWGLSGVGDGACDLLSAWAMFEAGPREVFRRAMGATDADWLRGAGWALSMAVIYLPHAYENGLQSDMSERMIARLKEEFA